jgi:hypothetical protein
LAVACLDLVAEELLTWRAVGSCAAGAADDPSLMNPLLRQERLGTGWFGVVIGEMDGVLVDSTQDAHAQVRLGSGTG